MSLLIKNGTIVTAEEQYVADVLCIGEKIDQIERDLQPPSQTEVIDATGKYVFPGFIDPHTHVYLPAMGTFASSGGGSASGGKDDYETASRAALLGGTTCLFDFVLPKPSEEPLAALETWQNKGRGRSACDYSFHMGVTRYDNEVANQLREIVRGGIPSFKVHLAYRGILGLRDEELLQTLELARELGVITMAHCENADAIEILRERLIAEGKTGPEWHYHSRPPVLEADGTHHFLAFAELAGAHAYVAHLSCNEALKIAIGAKQRGNPVWIETLIQFLLLDKSYAEKADFEGAKYVMSPPLRDKENHAPLWDALRHGMISTVATDHAPFDFHGQKDRGRGDFRKIAGGLPGVQDRVNLLFTYGVREERITLERFVDAASTQAARLFGLYPQKGAIQAGSDADLVVYDPEYESTISSQAHAMNVDYNAFESWTVKGRAETVVLRGSIMVRNSEFVGEIGYGQFQRREPTHQPAS